MSAAASSTTSRVARVLVLAPTPFFGDRGCHVRIYEEARHVGACGVEPLVITYPVGRDVPGVTVKRAPVVPGIRPSPLGPSWSRPLLDATLTVTALRAARRFKPDVIHAHLHEGIAVGAAVRARTGIPLVADLQGSLTEELIDHRFLTRGGLASRLTRRVEQWLTTRPDAILVSSLTACNLVLPDGADRSRLRALPDGVDVDVFRPGLAPDALRARLGLGGRRVIVFLGVLTEYQGVDALIDAVPAVLAAVPDAHFLVMGYPNEEHYRRLVARRGLAAAITLPGRVPYADAAQWLGLGQIAVSAKQSLTEANGKLLNYMACGLPTVATDTPVNRELLGPHGVFVPVGSNDALAAAMIDLLRAPDRRCALAAALRARAEHEYSWPVLARRLVAIYETVVGQKLTRAA